MAKYINEYNGKTLGRAKFEMLKTLVKDIKTLAKEPEKLMPNLCCVILKDNMQSIGYCSNEQDFDWFKKHIHNQSKTWVLIPNAESLCSQ